MSSLILYRKSDGSGQVVQGTIKGKLLMATASLDWFRQLFDGLWLEPNQEREVVVHWEYADRGRIRGQHPKGRATVKSARGAWGKVMRGSVAMAKEEKRRG